MKDLSVLDQELLHQIYIHFAGMTFEETSVIPLRTEGQSGAELMLAFLSLRRKGYVVATEKYWGERLYCISPEKIPSIHEAFFTPNLDEVEGTGIQLIRKEKQGIVLDIFSTLVFLSQYKPLLTTKGTLYKKSIQGLTAVIQLDLEDLRDLSLDVLQPLLKDYPQPIAVILDLLVLLNLVSIDMEEKQVIIHEKSLYQWLSLSTEEMTSIVFHIVNERYNDQHREMQHFCQSIRCSTFRAGAWLDVDKIMHWMIGQGLLVEAQRGEWQSKAVAWLHALVGFGWMDMAISEGYFRWKRQSEYMDESASSATDSEYSSFYVQPDYDIMIPPNVGFLQRWRVLLFTEMMKNDHMSVYRLTKQSIARGLSKGIVIEEMIQFLEEHSLGEVPEHVSIVLEQWAREMHDESFEARNGQLFHSIEGEGANGVFMDSVRLLSNTVEDIPTPESLFQGMEQIPMRWRKEFRSYHFSTTTTIVEQALAWHTKVEMTMNGKLAEFTPTNICYSPWMVRGELTVLQDQDYQVIELYPNDFQEIKLLIPPFK
ncbi:helicase-associated domain-containing protein [Paenibacillus sp. IHBB 10380]|uniref:helicase-associated domain-containing protein n=1 Tax=Paenibacillus sp. IHBB 10380 TaxID=1566358 RepID=UPI0005CFD3E7|nr:helicase-associated domain-containing protein [Paenibacillus sp. IHBB 10380]AJS57846.1 hypothetical protein UB51_04330 [Paenibacillus sp. IHBB 10380]